MLSQAKSKYDDIVKNILNKNEEGFYFQNKDYCHLYGINVLYHLCKEVDNLILSEEDLLKLNNKFIVL